MAVRDTSEMSKTIVFIATILVTGISNVGMVRSAGL